MLGNAKVETNTHACPHCQNDITTVVKHAIDTRLSQAARKAAQSRHARGLTPEFLEACRKNAKLARQKLPGNRYAVEMWPGGRREYHVFPDQQSIDAWLQQGDTHRAQLYSKDSELRKQLRLGNFTDHGEVNHD